MVVPTSDNQLRMIRGVMNYARDVPEFRIAKHAAIPYLPWSLIDQLSSDGVIAYAESEEQVSRLARLNVPAVNVTLHTEPADGIPVVHSDNALIGKLAAEHLMSLGLRHFVFVGHFEWYHNRLRRDGFSECLSEHGHSCHHIGVDFEAETTADLSVRRIKQTSLQEELSSIPGPLGVVAAHDEFAFEIVEACNAIGRSVPFDVAVIGVNDYRLICETTTPPLSSIAQNSERIGYLAAELVHSLMRGESAPRAPVLELLSRVVF